MYCANTAEPMERRCSVGGGLTHVGSRNHVLNVVEILTERNSFGSCPANLKALGVSAAVYAAKRPFNPQ